MTRIFLWMGAFDLHISSAGRSRLKPPACIISMEKY